jgi:hypothetical protein
MGRVHIVPASQRMVWRLQTVPMGQTGSPGPQEGSGTHFPPWQMAFGAQSDCWVQVFCSQWLPWQRVAPQLEVFTQVWPGWHMSSAVQSLPVPGTQRLLASSQC